MAVRYSGVEVAGVSAFKRLQIKWIYCRFRKLAGVTDRKRGIQ